MFPLVSLTITLRLPSHQQKAPPSPKAETQNMIVWYQSELTHSVEITKEVESFIWLKINKNTLCAEQHVCM